MIATPPDALEFMTRAVDDAARFRETVAIIRRWLGEVDIYILDSTGPIVDFIVFGYDMKEKGRLSFQEHRPTFAEALSFALQEARKRFEAGDRR